MQAFTIENDVLTSLAGPVSNSATSITVKAPVAPFRAPPAPLSAGQPGVLTIVDRLPTPTAVEIITYTGRVVNGDGSVTLTGVTRAQQGTTARAWTAAAQAYQAPTRDQLQQSVLGAALGSAADGAAVRALIGAGTGSGSVVSVSATAPVTSTGGSAPTIGMPAATPIADGHMTAVQATKLAGIEVGANLYTDALARGQVEAMLIAGANVTFDTSGSGSSRTITINATGAGGTGGGTVTSVGLSMPSIFEVSGSPITGAGTLTAALADAPLNLFLAGAATAPIAPPTFRSITAGDLPTLPPGKVDPPGSDKQVVFNDAGVSGAHFGLVYTKGSQQLNVGGLVVVADTASVLGGVSGGTFSAGLRTESSGGFASVGLASNSTFGIVHRAQLTADSAAVGVNSAELRRIGVVAGAAAPFFFDGAMNRDLRHTGTPLTDSDVPADIVTESTTSRAMANGDAGKYIRFTNTGAKTATFGIGITGGEFHVRNAAASDLTLTPSSTTLNAPAGGTLVVPVGGTVTVKWVASAEFDVFGTTTAA